MKKGDWVMLVIRAARPTFNSKSDIIAFAVHASFHASGYVLTATGPLAHSDTALSDDEVGIEGWNQQEGEYSFVYKVPAKNWVRVSVSCLVMNDKLLVDVSSKASSELLHLAINVQDYAGEDGSRNFSDHYKNFDELVKSLDRKILSKLHDSLSASSSSNPRSSEISDRTWQEMYAPSVEFEAAGPSNRPSWRSWRPEHDTRPDLQNFQRDLTRRKKN